MKYMMAAIIVLASGILPAAYGHGIGIDTVQAEADGMPLRITAEMPIEFAGDEKRLTISVTDQTSETMADVILSLAVVHQNATLLQDTFLAPGGVLALDIATGTGNLAISGQEVPGRDILGGPAVITGPVFGSGGLYTMHVTILEVGGDIITEPETYLADLSVAESILQESEPVRFTTKSYYDTVESFSYDADAGEVSFVMPFDWRESRMMHIPVIHQEISFPNTAEEFMSRGYVGVVNGFNLFRSSVTVDDYTTVGERTVHFVLLQDHLQLIKSQLERPGGQLPEYMTFTLTKTPDVRSQMSTYTRNGDYQVDMTWEPEEILPDQDTKFIFTIRDAYTGETLRNSDYDFVLIREGTEIYRNSGTAVVGGDVQEYRFTEEQGGPATVRIENIRNEGQSVEFVFVVVPEFGALAGLVLAASISSVIVLGRRIWPGATKIGPAAPWNHA